MRRHLHTTLTAAVVAVLLWIPPSQAESGIGLPAPEINAQRWFNAEPQQLADLRGKVTLVEFWTFGCYNCRNVEPHVKQWHDQFAAKGLAVIGIHTPETIAERDPENVRQYIREHGILYPVATDNDFTTWNRFDNHAWPAWYLIDKRGVTRFKHVGEGEYEQTAQQIQALLAEP